MILVTGATGTTGGATLRALQSAAIPVRVLVRDPSAFEAPAGVEVATGHFEDAASLAAALTGVDHAYLVSPGSERQVELETLFIEAARRAGLGHLVRLSVVGADQPWSARTRLGANHQRLEAVVRDSGIPWTFLRPNGFLQNYLGQAAAIAAQGTFYSSLSPAATISHVDAEDIGAVAARALTEPRHEGQAYTLTGPEALSNDDVAARLSSALDRQITHTQIPIESVRESMRTSGSPQWNVDALPELLAFYETEHAAQVSPDIERVLGRPARSIDNFARDHRAAFGG